MSIDISDLGGISKPLEKLITEVSKGIGTLYRPRAIRTERDAEAAGLKALEIAKAEAAEEVKDIALSGALGRVVALVGNDPGLVERAKIRLAHKEIEGQANIEGIADAAIKYLPTGDPSPDPLSDDWRRMFFKHAEDVSDTKLQDIWARILAGEIARPSTFSLRTLDDLAALTTHEAKLFDRFLSICFTGDLAGAVTSGELPGINYDDLMHLSDAGLIHRPDPIQRSWQPVQEITYQVFTYCGGTEMYIIVPAGTVLKPIKYVALSQSGRDLQKLGTAVPNHEHLKATALLIEGEGHKVLFTGANADSLNAFNAMMRASASGDGKGPTT